MSRLDDIVDRFRGVDTDLKIQLLLDYAKRLPPLPEKFARMRDAGAGQVHECMTPVYVYVERENGALRLHVDVAPEAPTIRGFAGIVVRAFDGATADEVAALPDDLVAALGLGDVIRMNRVLGLSAFVARIKREAAAGDG